MEILIGSWQISKKNWFLESPFFVGSNISYQTTNQAGPLNTAHIPKGPPDPHLDFWIPMSPPAPGAGIELPALDQRHWRIYKFPKLTLPMSQNAYIIGKMLVPSGWYPTCLTLQGALWKWIYPINTHNIRCIWGWLLGVPSQGYQQFPYEYIYIYDICIIYEPQLCLKHVISDQNLLFLPSWKWKMALAMFER